ncbi:MAG TPA: hypothetical protein VF843_08010 [Streptosporangiaceae bacterium]
MSGDWRTNRGAGAAPDPARAGLDRLDLDRAGLDKVFGALTAPGSADELAGEPQALAAFRVATAAGHRSRQARPAARPPSWRPLTALASAAAVVIVAMIGAAYAEVLPAPVQRAAYHLLGFAGVPSPGQSGPSASGHRPHGHVTASAGPGRSSSPGQPAPSRSGSGRGRSGSAKPTPGRPARSRSGSPAAIAIAITPQAAQIAADAHAVISARASAHGQPARAIRLTLQEQPAGQTGWTAAGTVTTRADGTAVVRTAALTVNTSFRFTDGSGDASATASVTVVLPVTIAAAQVKGKKHLAVSVSVPLASPGDDVVVQAWSGSGWLDVKTRQLGQHGVPVIVTLPPQYAGAQVRAVLKKTTAHAASVSPPITAPAA